MASYFFSGFRGEKGTTGEVGFPGFGLPGPVGKQGSPGVPGYLGLQGPPGLTGDSGVPGPCGQKGEHLHVTQLQLKCFFKSVSVQNKFQTKFSGLLGPQGSDGGQGAPGRSGVSGAPGMTGERGFNGQDGAEGCEGPRGEKGKHWAILQYCNPNCCTTLYSRGIQPWSMRATVLLVYQPSVYLQRLGWTHLLQVSSSGIEQA